MNKLLSTAVLVILAVACITPAYSQKAKSKDDSFKEIATLSNTKKPEDIEKAYQLGKEFLTRFGNDKDPNVAKVRTFVNNYREASFYKAAEGNKFDEAFAIGKEILAEQPDNTSVIMNLAFAGYTSSGTGSKTYSEDSIAYARKAVQLLEAGNLPKSFSPFKDKNEAEAYMLFVDGSLSMDKDSLAAAKSIYKSTLIDSSIKNNSLPYYSIAAFYEDVYAKMSTELKGKVDAKTISDADFKTESARVDKVIDLMLDAYARTCKRADAENNPNKAQFKDRMTQVYKFRKKTDMGLNDYIASIDSTPMPEPTKP